ncbi:MAG TPA: TetR/AcrR family transcriptional regulator [Acidimicrobiales bacterium]|nr:TetR/AcrR family transcriptional regulator [Acidimicrobiales bacterium]
MSRTAVSTGPKRGPGRPRNTEHDHAITRAALEILATDGYNGLTIDAVASRAGVGRPTVYRRWPSKAALVIGVLAEVAPRPTPADTGNLRDDLLTIRRHQLSALLSPRIRRVLPGLVADVAEDAELRRRFHQQYVEPWRAAFDLAVRRGIERGEVRADADPQMVADLLTGAMVYRVLFAGERPNRQAMNEAVEMVLQSLAA